MPKAAKQKSIAERWEQVHRGFKNATPEEVGELYELLEKLHPSPK